MKEQPGEARAKIVEVFRLTRAHRGEAATAMGCSRATFDRSVQILGLTAELDLLEKDAEENGWRHQKDRLGRPKKTAA